jgi:CelD/BcsL family acetyltransferase involved in cellulose biosynthesis
MARVRSETVTLAASEIGAVEQSAWRELGDRAAEPNPFYEPEFMMPAFRQLGLRGAGLRVVREGRDWVACWPVSVAPMANASLVGLWHPYVLLCTPLIRADRLEAGARGLLAARRGGVPAVVAMRSAGGDGPVDRALTSAGADLGLRRAWERRLVRAAARPLDGAPRPRRPDLQRRRRRLQEALDGDLTIEDRAGSDDAVQEFLELEAAGWKGRAGTALASCPNDRAFFIEMAAACAARGRLRLMAMRLGTRTVAMACELLDGDSIFGFKMAYDEQLRRFAPGVQLLDALLERFHQDGRLRLYDSCSDPNATMVNQLYGDQRAIVSTVAAPRGLARPVGLGMQAAPALHRQIKAWLSSPHRGPSVGRSRSEM